jgi:hypothetical protein
MYWYGWMSFAAVLASAVAGVTCLVPGPMAKRI